MYKLNKKQLINILSQNAGLTKQKSRLVIHSICNSIKNTLASGNEVKIISFGSFALINRSARIGRNPKNGDKVNVPKLKQLSFRASKKLKNNLNLKDANNTNTSKLTKKTLI